MRHNNDQENNIFHSALCFMGELKATQRAMLCMAMALLAIGIIAVGQHSMQQSHSILLSPTGGTETFSALPAPVTVSSDAYVAEAIVDDHRVADIVVYLVGGIMRPGVYYVQLGTRLVTVVDMAGGFHELADREAANLAMELKDGQRYRIPLLGDTPEISMLVNESGAPLASSIQQKVNVNTADIAMLQTLPGIGPSRAQAIVDYRSKQGAFQLVDDIKRVSGIGESIFAQIHDRITVE